MVALLKCQDNTRSDMLCPDDFYVHTFVRRQRQKIATILQHVVVACDATGDTACTHKHVCRHSRSITIRLASDILKATTGFFSATIAEFRRRSPRFADMAQESMELAKTLLQNVQVNIASKEGRSVQSQRQDLEQLFERIGRELSGAEQDRGSAADATEEWLVGDLISSASLVFATLSVVS